MAQPTAAWPAHAVETARRKGLANTGNRRFGVRYHAGVAPVSSIARSESALLVGSMMRFQSAQSFSPNETYAKTRKVHRTARGPLAGAVEHARLTLESSLSRAFSVAVSEIGASRQRAFALREIDPLGKAFSTGAPSSIERAPLRQRDFNHPVKRIGSPTVLNVEEVVAQC